MNFRNKYAVNTVRILLGLLLLFSGVSGLMMGRDAQGIPENMVLPMQVLYDTGIFHIIKITEVVVGVMLIIGFLPWLALLAVAPLAVGIAVVNARMQPQYLPFGLLVGIFAVYLGYAYWHKYKPLFERKA